MKVDRDRDYGWATSEARRRFHAIWNEALAAKDYRTLARCKRISDKREARSQRKKLQALVEKRRRYLGDAAQAQVKGDHPDEWYPRVDQAAT